MNICKNPKCGKETTNPKYCCRKCATVVNNTLFPKRSKQTHICKHCGKEVYGRKTVCDLCNTQVVDWTTVTYLQMSGKRSYQKNSRIRDIARRDYCRSDKPQVCAVCGYTKHFHICHIKPINSFPDDTPVSVINNIDNLIALCPNHHWELDNGLFSL